MEHSQALRAVFLALLYLLPWCSPLPLAANQQLVVPGYSAAYSGYPTGYYVVPGPSKSFGTKGASSTQYSDVGSYQDFPSQGYIIAPYQASGGVIPDSLYRSASTGGGQVDDIPSGGQYFIYPYGGAEFRQDRPGLLQGIQNFLQGLRPGNRPERPEQPNRPVSFLNPFTWFGSNQQSNNENPPVQPVQGGAIEGGSSAQPVVIQGAEEEVVANEINQGPIKEEENVQRPQNQQHNGAQTPVLKPSQENEQAAETQKPEEAPEPEEDPKPDEAPEPEEAPKPEEAPEPVEIPQPEEVPQPAEEVDDAPVEVETIPEASVVIQGTEDAEAEAAEIVSRILERSRYLPKVGFPRNVPRRRSDMADGGSAGAGGATSSTTPATDEDVGEQEEDDDDDDSVVIGPGGTNPSVAQAKPAAIALAGVGGVAAAAPSATAVVGANGLAVSAPSATAIAGPSAGAPPPGLLPKFPTQRVPAHKVSAEEARRNAAMIQAARRQAQLLASGLGNFRSYGYPTLPFMPYQAWRGGDYGLN